MLIPLPSGEQDLLELGVGEKGRRKRILDALMNLRNWSTRISRQRFEARRPRWGTGNLDRQIGPPSEPIACWYSRSSACAASRIFCSSLTHLAPHASMRKQNEQLFMGRYSVQGTATWGTVLVMTGVDAKTATPVCLKVTSHRPSHESELRCRRKLSDEYVVALFDVMPHALLEPSNLNATRDSHGSFSFCAGHTHTTRLVVCY